MSAGGEPHAALFEAIRAEVEVAESRDRVVPRSFRAALLAGLVVGCCLAGLDATRAEATLRHVRDLAGDTTIAIGDPERLLPVLILLGLLGGARAAATNLLVAHWALRRAGWTHHVAYTAAGALVAAGMAGLAYAITASGLMDAATLPSHGLATDMVAGAATGFFYRVFAGSVAA